MSTTEKGKAYERLVAALQKMLDPDSEVTWDWSSDGRQVDVKVEGQVGSTVVVILVECRDYADPIEVDAMEAWAEKSRRLGADKAIMVTSSRYRSGALKAAQAAGIDACVLKKADDKDWEGYLRTLHCVVQEKVPRYEDFEFETASKEWVAATGLSQLVDGAGKRDFADRVASSVLDNYGASHGTDAPEGRPITAKLIPPPTLIRGGADPVEVVQIRFRYTVVDGMRVAFEHSAPEDWVFFKVTPDEVIPEKRFFCFEELEQLGAAFRRGQPL